jgi:transposase
VHSGYHRRLPDAAVAGREVLIQQRVRRLFCENAVCAQKTFAEQVPGLTIRCGRRSPVQVLTDRTADTLASWLREHRSAEIICQDSTGAYADGARVGAGRTAGRGSLPPMARSPSSAD